MIDISWKNKRTRPQVESRKYVKLDLKKMGWKETNSTEYASRDTVKAYRKKLEGKWHYIFIYSYNYQFHYCYIDNGSRHTYSIIPLKIRKAVENKIVELKAEKTAKNNIRRK